MDTKLTEQKQQMSEELYQLWHSRFNKVKFGFQGKPIKNWSLVKSRDSWSIFEKLAKMVIESEGQIKPNYYMDALFDYTKGDVPSIGLLVSQRGIQIYKNYLKRRKLDKLFLK